MAVLLSVTPCGAPRVENEQQHAAQLGSVALHTVFAGNKKRKFCVGDFVDARGPNQANTLQVAAQQLIVRITKVMPNGGYKCKDAAGLLAPSMSTRQHYATCHIWTAPLR